jgi:hypothetical protein
VAEDGCPEGQRKPLTAHAEPERTWVRPFLGSRGVPRLEVPTTDPQKMLLVQMVRQKS